MILVTGATGNIGNLVVRRLAEKNIAARALSRSARNGRGSVEFLQGDFTDEACLGKAMQGISKVVLISPAHPDMVAHQLAVVRAARTAGVKHIVKLSGLGAGPDAPIRLPKLHYQIEQEIIASGITYTFVRPNLFMQVLLGSAEGVANDGKIYAPAADGAISFTNAEDVAEVIFTALTQAGHENKVYEITGPQALTYGDVAALLQELTAQPVTYVAVSEETAHSGMLASGMDPWLVDAFMELFGIYRAGYGAAVLSDTIRTVTGHDAGSMSAFIKDSQSLWLSRQAS